MKKILLVGGGVVAVAVVGAIAVFMFVLSSLDGLIQQAIEQYGSEITKTQVTLAEVELDATSGKGVLRGLRIGNPAGFDTPSAFQLGAISITIDTASLASDTVVITEIVIDAPDVTYELSGGGSNIDAIQRNVEAYMARFESGDSATADGGGEGPRLIIEDLYITNGTINVSATFLGGKSLTTPLPDIHLEDIGAADDGASPGEIAEQIIAAIRDGATGAVSGLGLEELMGSAGELLESVTEGGGEALEGVGEVLEGVTEGAGEALEGAGDALDNLFGSGD